MLAPFHRITLRIWLIFQLRCYPKDRSTVKKYDYWDFLNFFFANFGIKIEIHLITLVKPVELRIWKNWFRLKIYLSGFYTESNILDSIMNTVVCFTQRVCFQCNFSWSSKFAEEWMFCVTVCNRSVWCCDWFQVGATTKIDNFSLNIFKNRNITMFLLFFEIHLKKDTNSDKSRVSWQIDDLKQYHHLCDWQRFWIATEI